MECVHFRKHEDMNKSPLIPLHASESNSSVGTSGKNFSSSDVEEDVAVSQPKKGGPKGTSIEIKA